MRLNASPLTELRHETKSHAGESLAGIKVVDTITKNDRIDMRLCYTFVGSMVFSSCLVNDVIASFDAHELESPAFNCCRYQKKSLRHVKTSSVDRMLVHTPLFEFALFDLAQLCCGRRWRYACPLVKSLQSYLSLWCGILEST